MPGRELCARQCEGCKGFKSQLTEFLSRAKETYKELDKNGEVSTAKGTKEMNTEIVSPSFMPFARERTQMIYNNPGVFCRMINID